MISSNTNDYFSRIQFPRSPATSYIHTHTFIRGIADALLLVGLPPPWLRGCWLVGGSVWGNPLISYYSPSSQTNFCMCMAYWGRGGKGGTVEISHTLSQNGWSVQSYNFTLRYNNFTIKSSQIIILLSGLLKHILRWTRIFGRRCRIVHFVNLFTVPTKCTPNTYKQLTHYCDMFRCKYENIGEYSIAILRSATNGKIRFVEFHSLQYDLQLTTVVYKIL
jgi:hypothetical protein